MDYVDKDGVIHKNYPPQQAEKRGWKLLDDKAKVKEKVKVTSKKIKEEEE